MFSWENLNQSLRDATVGAPGAVDLLTPSVPAAGAAVRPPLWADRALLVALASVQLGLGLRLLVVAPHLA